VHLLQASLLFSPTDRPHQPRERPTGTDYLLNILQREVPFVSRHQTTQSTTSVISSCWGPTSTKSCAAATIHFTTSSGGSLWLVFASSINLSSRHSSSRTFHRFGSFAREKQLPGHRNNQPRRPSLGAAT